MTLSEMSVFFRQFVKVGAVVIVLLILGRFTWVYVADYWARTHIAPPPPPNFALGTKIPKLRINLPQTTFNNTQIVLDTLNGNLPKTTPVVPLYEVSQPTVTLLSLDRARALATSLGFKSEPETLSGTEYQWKDPETNRTLKLQTTDFNFHLVQDNPNPKQTITFSEAIAINDVKSFLQQRSLLTPEFMEGTASAKFVNISDAGIRQTFRDDANGVLVDVFPTPIENKYPLLNTNAKEALVRAMVTSQRQIQSSSNLVHTIAELKYTNWQIEKGKQGTYPVKPIEVAWDEFQNNKSYLSVGSGTYSQVTINDISLAYFLSEEYQSLLQPIFVFTGKGVTPQGAREDFIAYLPAISTVAPAQK